MTTSSTTETQVNNNIAVEELEQLLRNIGAFGNNRVTHADVEIIVSEHCPTHSAATAAAASEEELHADKILMKIL